jgi:hypothetical protein
MRTLKERSTLKKQGKEGERSRPKPGKGKTEPRNKNI